MRKLHLLLPFAAVLCLASTFTSTATAAPVPSFFQQDSLKEVFLASSLTAKLPTKCGPYCDTSFGGVTPTASAIGTTCALATSSLSTQLKSYANSYCGTNSCAFVVTTTVACHAISGGFSVSGYATFGCRDTTC
jgi:hypothetical protein